MQFLHEEDNYNNTINKNHLMPKAAILFSVLLLSIVISNSYALTSGDLISLDEQNQIIFDIERILLSVDIRRRKIEGRVSIFLLVHLFSEESWYI